jgi:hypothetical protein
MEGKRGKKVNKGVRGREGNGGEGLGKGGEWREREAGQKKS